MDTETLLQSMASTQFETVLKHAHIARLYLSCTILYTYGTPLCCSYRLKDFAKMYDIIKNERNKIVNLIQTSTQRAAEMREKIKILQNEIEILRTAVNNKDR